jgi:hypothetical protein
MSLGTLDLLHVYGKHDVELMAEICGLERFKTIALCAEVRPGPLEKDAEPQAALSQKLYVDQHRDEPSHEAAHHHTPALQHGKILEDHGKIALVEVTKKRNL